MNTANAAPRSVKSSLKGGPEDNSLLTVVKNSKTETEEPQPQKPAEEKRLGAFHRAQPRKFDVLWGRATSQRFFVLKRERCDAESCPQEDFELAGTTGNVYSIKIARQPQCNCPHGLKGYQCKTRHLRTYAFPFFLHFTEDVQRHSETVPVQGKHHVESELLTCCRFCFTSRKILHRVLKAPHNHVYQPCGAAQQRAQGNILETSPVGLRR